MICLFFLLFLFESSVHAASIPSANKLLRGDNASTNQPFLPADQAFSPWVEKRDPASISVEFLLSPGYYLYRHKISVDITPAQSFHYELPKGETRFDEFMKDHEIFKDKLSFNVFFDEDIHEKSTITLYYQGCAEAGFCYPPMQKSWQLQASQWVSVDEPIASKSTEISEQEQILKWLYEKNPLWIACIFLSIGILLSFTPCVLPMLPILSGLILSERRETLSSWRAFKLSCAYALGMMTVYTSFGLLAGTLGLEASAFLQKPIVLTCMAIVLFYLGCLQFGKLHLRGFGSKWFHLTGKLQRLEGGKIFNTFCMGAVSFLILSPCVTPILVGTLAYLSQTKHMWLGGLALFSTSLGMSIPLVLFGVLEGRFLPHTGKWMTHVKRLFGLLLMVMAAASLWQAWQIHTHTTLKSLFENESTIQHPALFSQKLNMAARQGKAVVVDVYASWCSSCRHFESTVLADKTVQEQLKSIYFIRLDVTEFAEFRPLLQQLSVLAPPTLLFFDKNGNENAHLRLVGETSKERFLEHVNEINQ